MESPIHFYIVLFVFAGNIWSRGEALEKKYVSLTSDVHKYYKTSSVFFMISQRERAFEEHTVLHLLSREFSQKGILTMITSFRELGQLLTFYHKRIHRPLIAVLLKGKRDIEMFIAITQNMIMSYPIWLIIFEGVSGNPVCTFCKHPMANIFDLRFDTEMLVMCCEDPILREWWANNENRTEKTAFASWNEEDGLKLLTKEGLYVRRNNVNGAGLRIAIVPNASSLVIDYGDNAVGGLFGDILQELNHRLNFTITKTIRLKTYGSWNPSDRKWSGAFGQLVQENADFGLADFTMTSRRLDVVDFTLPFLTIKNQLFIRKPDGSRVKWSAYFEAFTVGIWVTILILIVTTPILLTVIQVKGSSIPSPLIFQNYLYVWGIFCQQGLCEFPTETPLRIAYSSIFISALVVYTSYSASLTSYLTVSSATLPFTSLDGLMNDGSYKLIVYRDSAYYDFFATSTDTFLRGMMKIMKPKTELPGNEDEAWDQICEERVALFASKSMKLTKYAHIKCEISVIDTPSLDSLAMVMTAKNQYTDVINYNIQRFQDNGILNRLKNKHIIKPSPKERTYGVVSLSGIAPLLLVFGCGIILSFILMFCEQIHGSYLKSNAEKCPNSAISRKTTVLRRTNYHRKKKLTRRNLRPHVKWQTGLYNNSRIGYYP